VFGDVPQDFTYFSSPFARLYRETAQNLRVVVLRGPHRRAVRVHGAYRTPRRGRAQWSPVVGPVGPEHHVLRIRRFAAHGGGHGPQHISFVGRHGTMQAHRTGGVVVQPCPITQPCTGTHGQGLPRVGAWAGVGDDDRGFVVVFHS
jgi:hypothetical protein